MNGTLIYLKQIAQSKMLIQLNEPITNAKKLMSIAILRFLETFAQTSSGGFNFKLYAEYKKIIIGIIII